jgi:predicted SAM-dependent methyltransferase
MLSEKRHCILFTDFARRRTMVSFDPTLKGFIRSSLATLNRPLAQRRFTRAVATSDGPLRISIGAGNRRLEGWINTDVHWRTRFYLDLLKPWPVPDGSVAAIYADNVIEHFSLEDFRHILQYAFVALAEGAIIRLVTPDVGRTVQAYVNNDTLANQHLERHRKAGYSAEYPVDLLRITFAECGHHLGFCHDFQSLSSELVRSGFSDCCRKEVGQSDIPEFRNLEARLEPSEAATSLVVEAKKVGRTSYAHS